MPFRVVEDEVYGPIIDITQVEDPWAEFLEVTMSDDQKIIFEIQNPTIMTFMRTPRDTLRIAFDQSDVSVQAGIVDYFDLGDTIVDNEKFIAEVMANNPSPISPLSRLTAFITPGVPRPGKPLKHVPVVGSPFTVGVMLPAALTKPLIGQKLSGEFTFRTRVASIKSIVLEEYGESRRPDPNDPHTQHMLDALRHYEEEIAKQQSAREDEDNSGG